MGEDFDNHRRIFDGGDVARFGGDRIDGDSLEALSRRALLKIAAGRVMLASLSLLTVNYSGCAHFWLVESVWVTFLSSHRNGMFCWSQPYISSPGHLPSSGFCSTSR